MRVAILFVSSLLIITGLVVEHISCMKQVEQLKVYLESDQYKADLYAHMKRMEGLK